MLFHLFPAASFAVIFDWLLLFFALRDILFYCCIWDSPYHYSLFRCLALLLLHLLLLYLRFSLSLRSLQFLQLLLLLYLRFATASSDDPICASQPLLRFTAVSSVVYRSSRSIQTSRQRVPRYL